MRIGHEYWLLALIAIHVIGCGYLAHAQDRNPYQPHLSKLKSDSYSISQNAARQLKELIYERGTQGLKPWFDEKKEAALLREAVKATLDAKSIKILLSDKRTNDVVLATLEVLARLSEAPKSWHEPVVNLMNDQDRSTLLRQFAFRTLCSLADEKTSVIDLSDDLESVFNFWQLDGSTINHSGSTWNKYMFVGFMTEYLYMILEDTQHVKAEASALKGIVKTGASKSMRIWALMTLSYVDISKANQVSQRLLGGPDPDLRFFACYILCVQEPDATNRLQMIGKANLSGTDRDFLFDKLRKRSID